MAGKIISILLVLTTLAVGGGVYYAQVYGYYEELAPEEVQLVSLTSELPEPIPTDAFLVIDAECSSILFRACFET